MLKLAINISLAVQMLAFAEGLLLAERAGIDPKLAVDVMTQSPIGSPMLKARADLVLDLPDEAWFDVGLMQKDVALALDTGRELRVPLPSAAAADGAHGCAGVRLRAARHRSALRGAGTPDKQPSLRATDKPGPAPRESARRDWRAVARAWGPPGNERLTTSTGLVLLVLLAVETLTTLALRTYLPVHIFLGLLLLPPVALKLASTGWRFLRYYTRNKPYRLEGPPRLLLRLLAPLLVASTLSLFGSGVALIVVGHGGGLLLSVHTLSFIAWGVLMIVHVLAYLARTLPGGPGRLAAQRRAGCCRSAQPARGAQRRPARRRDRRLPPTRPSKPG